MSERQKGKKKINKRDLSFLVKLFTCVALIQCVLVSGGCETTLCPCLSSIPRQETESSLLLQGAPLQPSVLTDVWK